MPAIVRPLPTTSLVPKRSTMPRAARRDDEHRERHRQQAHAGLQCRVAHDELQVLREQEDRAEHREEQQHDAQLAAVKRGFLKNDVSSIGLVQYDSQIANAPSTMIAIPNAQQDRRRRPAVVGSLDDGVHQRDETDDRQQRTDRVERGLRRVPRRRDAGTRRAISAKIDDRAGSRGRSSPSRSAR